MGVHIPPSTLTRCLQRPDRGSPRPGRCVLPVGSSGAGGVVRKGRLWREWLDRAANYRRRQHATPIRAVAANLAAEFHPATFDIVAPAIHIAGVWVVAHINPDGVLQVSVHLDDTEAWLVSTDSTVPMRVTVQDTDVFTG